MSSTTDTLEKVLSGLMQRYQQRVPDVAAIIKAMIKAGIIAREQDIENDHIAFRTLGVPHLGIASLEKIFLYYGYQKRDYYYFKEKKLNAYWYAPPVAGLPRIFVSELRVADLSPQARQIIHHYTDKVSSDPVDAINLDDAVAVDHYLHSSSWELPTLADYEAMAAESEYAAWAIYNRYYLNHYTLSVHNLPKPYDTLEVFNGFLEQNGIVLNDAGGKIKQSPDGNLLQSSTVAGMVDAEFAGGDHKAIPGSYVEFAERRVLEAFRHLPADQITPAHRREGFEAGNADKIFESTYLEQAGKR
ncbi:DUF1338 domain-containing protein [Paraflavitalea soli]|uniref:2-oxoadipate dioxygenase/decarboxylase n=1 Tax=Paraflavitalea soli TaxID=2315862 RepID=A0A3B7MJ59_9BACT|nr:DUF1338 domain-containing protein [Paraflavitalea soli]AXY73269.1 DUF1338 domain-containing protein [Paraflavitalea soli]